MIVVNPNHTIYESPVVDFSKNGCVWQVDNFFTDEFLEWLSQKAEENIVTPFPPLPDDPDQLVYSGTKRIEMVESDIGIRIHVMNLEKFDDLEEKLVSIYHTYRPLSVFGKHIQAHNTSKVLNLRTILGMTYPKTMYNVHNDAGWKYVSMIIYLGESGDGTRFVTPDGSLTQSQTPSWSGEVEVPWKNNCGYFFFANELSSHYYCNTSSTNVRNACILNLV